MSLLTLCTFRVVQFLDADPDQDGVPLYVGVAWNYGRAVLMSTTPHRSYTGARAELDRLVAERRCSLRWFDGEYVCDGGKDDAMVREPHRPEHEREHALGHSGLSSAEETGSYS